MLPPVFQIDELLRVVIDELVQTRPRAAVSFALTCRSLEEPALSSLWKRQNSLGRLLKVLPGSAFLFNAFMINPSHCIIRITDDPSADDWVRLRRYASWMRGLDLSYGSNRPSRIGQVPTIETLSLLSSNSPGGLLFPNLKRLTWNVQEMETPLTFFRLFLSPCLQRIAFYTLPQIYLPLNRVTELVQIMSFLPPSLEYLSVLCREEWGDGGELLRNTVCSFVRRRGSSLRGFETRVPLSEVTALHLMEFPNLSHLAISQGPPKIAPASIFLSLEQLHLISQEALPWLHFLASYGQGASRADSAPVVQATNIRNMLKSLEYPERTIVDSKVLSSIADFRNSVILRVPAGCTDREDCRFRLTDDDVESLATTLPRLKTLRLGYPCRCNTWKTETTIVSLMSISVNCLDLEDLETHFYTNSIARDMRRLLDGGTSGREKPKCKLQSLSVGKMFISLQWGDAETIAMGFKEIFPYLKGFKGYTLVEFADPWERVQSKLLE